MSLHCDCHGKVVATSLIATAVTLAWCAVHIRHDVLISQQPCDTTYMYSAYTHVDIRSSPDAGLGAQSSPSVTQVQRSQSRSSQSQPVTAAAEQLAATVAVLSHSKYKLWRYTGDGIVASGSSHDPDWLALPVLFIPGNGGAFEVGRSLASETARRVSRLGPRVGASAAVDWYLLDLGTEWSAFDGDVLEQQVHFTLTAMRHLARIHNITAPAAQYLDNSCSGMRGTSRGKDSGSGTGADGGSRPRRLPLWPHPGLVVVGHSMGGVVAADALARAAEDPELGPSLAALLLTLGSPHIRPAVPGHPSLREFYSRAAVRSRPVVPVVALAGGLADVQVAAELTDPRALAPMGFSRHLELSQLTGGWCPASHNGLTSCNQAMVRLGQALVDMAQDALPGLQAARKAAALATSTAPDRNPDPTSKPRGRQPHRSPSPSSADSDSPFHRPDGPHKDDDYALYDTPDSANADRTAPMMLPWDWALRRIDQHLSHPAQPYLAAALVATTNTATATSAGENYVPLSGAAVKNSEQNNTGTEEELLRRARRALTAAPSNSGGGSGSGAAACRGANLAWYLQYNTPQAQPTRRRGRSPPLRLLSSDVDGGPATGRMYSWQLADPRGPVTGSKNAMAAGASGEQGLGPRGWVAVVSGANPCAAFRVWLSVIVEQPAVQQPSSTSVVGSGGDAGASAAGGGAGEESGREALEAEARNVLQAPRRRVRHDVEVTGLAAPLPALTRMGRWRTRVQEDWWEVTQGRDYQSRGAWLLLLPSSLVAPLLQQPDAPRVDWSGSGGATVTLTLTLWLGEPSYKPAFRVVAAALLPPAENMDQSLPLRLRAFTPAVLAAAPTKADVKGPGKGSGKATKNKPTSGAATTQLLVPIDVPYLTTANTGHSFTVAAIVRWLGLYRYAAVRIIRLDLHNSTNGHGGASQKPAAWRAGDDGSEEALDGGGCLHPVVVMSGGEGAGVKEKLRTTQLLRAAANLTLFSLEPCATHPGGCGAVTAILDPACSYQLDLVPYIAGHLQSLLLANAGQLWLGAQLAALLAVVAMVAATQSEPNKAAPPQTRPKVEREREMAQVEGSEVQAEGAPMVVAAESSRAQYERMPSAAEAKVPYGRRRRRFRGWPVLPLEGLAVLQAGLRFSLMAPATLLAAAAAAAAILAAHNTTAHTLASSPRIVAHFHRVWSSWGLPLTRAAGLCPQPHLQDCGWGVPSLLLQLLLPETASSAAPAPSSSMGSTTASSVLDWMALAAASATLTWLLSVVLQAAATLTAVAKVLTGLCWRMAVVLPAAVPTVPLRWLLRWKRYGNGRSKSPDVDHVVHEAMIMMTVCVRWLAVVVPLAGAVCLVGAPGALPCGALVVALLQLAMSLTSPSVVLTVEEGDGEPTRSAWETWTQVQTDGLRPTPSPTQATATADVTVARSPRRPPPLNALGVSAGSDRRRKEVRAANVSVTSLRSQQRLMTPSAVALMQRRCHTAWLLYYASYGLCAAPALAAALRRLVARPEDVRQFTAAVGEVIVAAVRARGDGLGAAGLWLVSVGIPVAFRWLADVVVHVVRHQVGYVLAVLHCLLLTGAVRSGGYANSGVSFGSGAGTTASGSPLCRYAAAMGCVVLGLGWWLVAPDTAHLVAAGVAGTQLLASAAAAWRQ